jgi:hypothetical protein
MKKKELKKLKKKYPITWPFQEIVEDLEELGSIDLPEGD